MRKLLAGLALVLMGLLSSPGASPSQTDGKMDDTLVGTWDCISLRLPAGYRHIKHVTPTHFTWVTDHRETMAPVGVAGGTWSREGDTYKDRVCE
jgi:hypothetical protein